MFFGNMSALMEASHTGERKGFVILNALQGLWDEHLYPTREAAEAILKSEHFVGADFYIVPARRKIEWSRPSAAQTNHNPNSPASCGGNHLGS